MSQSIAIKSYKLVLNQFKEGVDACAYVYKSWKYWLYKNFYVYIYMMKNWTLKILSPYFGISKKLPLHFSVFGFEMKNAPIRIKINEMREKFSK